MEEANSDVQFIGLKINQVFWFPYLSGVSVILHSKTLNFYESTWYDFFDRLDSVVGTGFPGSL